MKNILITLFSIFMSSGALASSDEVYLSQMPRMRNSPMTIVWTSPEKGKMPFCFAEEGAISIHDKPSSEESYVMIVTEFSNIVWPFFKESGERYPFPKGWQLDCYAVPIEKKYMGSHVGRDSIMKVIKHVHESLQKESVETHKNKISDLINPRGKSKGVRFLGRVGDTSQGMRSVTPNAAPHKLSAGSS